MVQKEPVLRKKLYFYPSWKTCKNSNLLLPILSAKWSKIKGSKVSCLQEVSKVQTERRKLIVRGRITRTMEWRRTWRRDFRTTSTPQGEGFLAGMPDVSLKAEFSLFDFLKKWIICFRSFKIIWDISKNLWYGLLKRCQIKEFINFRRTKLKIFSQLALFSFPLSYLFSNPSSSVAPPHHSSSGATRPSSGNFFAYGQFPSQRKDHLDIYAAPGLWFLRFLNFFFH